MAKEEVITIYDSWSEILTTPKMDGGRRIRNLVDFEKEELDHIKWLADQRLKEIKHEQS